MKEPEGAGGVAVNPHGSLDVIAAIPVGRNLHGQAIERDTVVAVDGAIVIARTRCLRVVRGKRSGENSRYDSHELPSTPQPPDFWFEALLRALSRLTRVILRLGLSNVNQRINFVNLLVRRRLVGVRNFRSGGVLRQRAGVAVTKTRGGPPFPGTRPSM